MTFFLGDIDQQDIAEKVALWHIKSEIEKPSLVSEVDMGLIKVTYNGPEPIIPFSVNDIDASLDS